MYQPAHFAPPDRDALLALMRSHPLATLIRHSDQGLCADVIPLMFDDFGAAATASGSTGSATEGRLTGHPNEGRLTGRPNEGRLTGRPNEGRLTGHCARANPLWRDADGCEVLVQFNGPQAYVSPGFYPSKALHGKVVPTWNYVVVQARGRLRAHDDAEWTKALVRDLTRRHEGRRAAPWDIGDAPLDYIEKMVQAIVGIEIEVTSLIGKWKLTQNRDAADRAGVVAGLMAEGDAVAQEVARRVGDPAAS
jgi:transcriptional regulator